MNAPTPAEVLKRETAAARRSALEDALALHLRAAGIPFEREHRFHSVRKWRFDFAVLPLERKLAVEVEGVVHVRRGAGQVVEVGRHQQATGVNEDCRKYAEAMCLGWRVLRVTGAHIKSGEAIRWIESLAAQE